MDLLKVYIWIPDQVSIKPATTWGNPERFLNQR